MEDKNVQKLLDMLFGMIDEAKGATFSSEKCVINRDEALDLLDEIRNKLPGELTKAQELMKSKEQYVDKANHEVRRMLDQAQDEAKRLREQAQAEAKRMLEKAQEDAKTIVSESETIQLARQKSSEIVRRAEERTREPSAAAARSSARPRTAAASCTRWPTPTPRTPCAGRRKPSRPPWTRCGSPASAIAAPPPNRCRPARRSSRPTPSSPPPRSDKFPCSFLCFSLKFTGYSAKSPHAGVLSASGMRVFGGKIEQPFEKVQEIPGKTHNSGILSEKAG